MDLVAFCAVPDHCSSQLASQLHTCSFERQVYHSIPDTEPGSPLPCDTPHGPIAPSFAGQYNRLIYLGFQIPDICGFEEAISHALLCSFLVSFQILPSAGFSLEEEFQRLFQHRMMIKIKTIILQLWI